MSTVETVDPRVEERTASLAAALEGQRLARLREGAAAAIRSEDAESERLRRIQATANALPDRAKAVGVEAAEKLRSAVEADVRACAVYNEAVGEAWDVFARSEPLPPGYAIRK